MLIFVFQYSTCKHNVYYFVNLKNFDPSLVEQYRATLCSYENYPQEILSFNKMEKLFNYFAFKEPFLQAIFQGYNLIITNSLINLENVKFIITEEVPKDDHDINLLLQYPKSQRILFSYETQISNPRSHLPKYLNYYEKIFTWNQQFVDNKKVFWLPAWIVWIDPMYMIEDIPSFQNKKICTLVASYMDSAHANSNHKERMQLINLCEQEDGLLDIYGTGWPKGKFRNYKGKISFNGNRRSNKINTIKNYRFYLCYENTKNVRGYITEKIFECFAAGCIPIYSGAIDIAQYIPRNCFIARSSFINEEELIHFMKSIDQKTYNEYLQNIRRFFKSDKAQLLSREWYVQKIRQLLLLHD